MLSKTNIQKCEQVLETIIIQHLLLLFFTSQVSKPPYSVMYTMWQSL